MKVFLDPVFAPEEIPDLVHFYPGEEWYNQQKVLIPLGAVNKYKRFGGTFTKADMARMLFWEYKPAKWISFSLMGILLCVLLKQVWPTEWLTPVFFVFFMVFAIATAYGNENFLSVVEYLVLDLRNKFVINKYLKKNLLYSDFISAYHQSVYRKPGRAFDILLAFIMGILWLCILLLFLSVFLINFF